LSFEVIQIGQNRLTGTSNCEDFFVHLQGLFRLNR
jgi:hypothetical protein